jgi:hypothetical protein
LTVYILTIFVVIFCFIKICFCFSMNLNRSFWNLFRLQLLFLCWSSPYSLIKKRGQTIASFDLFIQYDYSNLFFFGNYFCILCFDIWNFRCRDFKFLVSPIFLSLGIS